MKPSMHESFFDHKGHLTLPATQRNFKFCCVCGRKVRAHAGSLAKHFRGQHAWAQPQFLAFGEQPIQCMYSNWEEWLADPSRPLLVKAEFGSLRRGRPRKEARPSLLTLMAREDEEEEANRRAKQEREALQIDSNPDISSLVDQDVKQPAAAGLPGAEGSGSLLGKRDRPEPEGDEEAIQAPPRVASAVQILSSEPPGAAQKKDQKKSVRFEEV